VEVRGKLVVFEGIDGTGKTSLCNEVFNYLNSRGISCISTFEPTYGKWGKILRDSFSHKRLSPKEELELFIKDRKEHVSQIILPAILKGKIVLCDRYYLSTMAYQGARGFDVEEIKRQNEEFAPIPDVAFVLQLDVDKALHRISEKRGDKLNSFENREYLKKVATFFDSFNWPWIEKLDASKNKKFLISKVIDVIDKLDC